MNPDNCAECEHIEASFLCHKCELSGEIVPLFSTPADCPLKED